MAAAARDRPARGGQTWFSTTHWSVVLKARSPDEAESRDALATLCQAYWSPVYSFIRHRGHDPETARDLTQGFFAALLEKARDRRGAPGDEAASDPSCSRSVKNFLANEQDYQRAQKRGGGQAPISIDDDAWEAALAAQEPATDLTPEIASSREQWALALLDRAMLDLESEMERSGGRERFASSAPTS